MAFTEKPPQLPAENQALVGPDGKMTKPWRDYFSRLLQYLARMGASIP
jgi:hypothetical protein